MQTNETQRELFKKQQTEKIRLLEEQVIVSGKLAEKTLARPRRTEYSFQITADVPLTRRQKIMRILLLLSVACFFFGLDLAENFIFAGSDFYATALPWVIGGVLFPIVFYGCYVMLRYAYLRYHLPLALRLNSPHMFHVPRWFKLGMLSLITTYLTVLVMLSPLALSALACWAFNREVTVIDATANSLGSVRHKLGICNQTVSLSFSGNTATICIEHTVIGRQPNPGDSVILKGRRSVLGTYIDEIVVK